MLHETLRLNKILKLLHGDVVVVYIALLSRPGLACRVRDGGCEGSGVAREEEGVQCAFAYAAGPGDDYGGIV